MKSPLIKKIHVRKWTRISVPAGLIFAILGILLLLWNSKHLLRESSKGDVDRVSCRLKWLPQSQFAGNYVAQDKGFYADVNIECILRPGGQDFNAIKLVASGSDDFGIWGADQIIIARSKDIPVVALAVIYQKSPVCFFSRKGSGITTPHDFIGKKVAMQYGTNVRTEYEAMMKRLGIDMRQIEEIPSKYDLSKFLTGKVDVWNGYIINEPIVAQEKGVDVNIIMPADYGIKMYADCLFTTESMIAEKPDLVRRFVQATIRGWEYAIAHPDEAVDIVLAQDSKLKLEHEQKMLDASIPLIQYGLAKTKGIGWMEPSTWTEMEDILFTQGLVRKRVDIAKLYTNEFLPEK